jgi:hypothetical protein
MFGFFDDALAFFHEGLHAAKRGDAGFEHFQRFAIAHGHNVPGTVVPGFRSGKQRILPGNHGRSRGGSFDESTA